MYLEELDGMDFLTVAEIAARLRVSKMTVYRLVRNGHLSVVKVGRNFRVPAQSLRDYMSR
jgi:excisionase family DNA binding protein